MSDRGGPGAQPINPHFIVGLPRSGSTLLAALLNQNPRFHASGASAAQIVFQQLYRECSAPTELAALLTDDQRAALLRGVIDAVHHERAAGMVVFDTSRKWLMRIEQLVALFPLCRFIAMVRDPVEVVASLERARQGHAFRQSRLFEADTTLTQRVAHMMGEEGLVGQALSLIEDALLGPHAERMIVIDYHRLVAAPAETLKALYVFLRQPVYTHDFEQFSFDMPTLDAYLNTPGLHRVSGPLQARAPSTPLPRGIVQGIGKRAIWRDIESEATIVMGRET